MLSLSLAFLTLLDSLKIGPGCCLLSLLLLLQVWDMRGKRNPRELISVFSLGSYFLADLLLFLHISEFSCVCLVYCIGFLVVLIGGSRKKYLHDPLKSGSQWDVCFSPQQPRILLWWSLIDCKGENFLWGHVLLKNLGLGKLMFLTQNC